MSRVSARHLSAPRNWRKRIVNGLSSIASAPSRAPSIKAKDTSVKTQKQRASFCEKILIDYEAFMACESETESETSFVCSFNELWDSRMSPYMINHGVCTQSAPNCGQEVDDRGNPL